MKLIIGKFTEAKIFTDVVDDSAIEQIKELCNQEFLKDTTIRVMPDVHAGKGCTIGTTIKIKDKVVPNLVGVDVGCGVLTVQLEEKEIDYAKLDKVIREHVPSGQNIHEEIREVKTVNVEDFKSSNILSAIRLNKSLGSLGGGNHYIEISKDEDGFLYLSIHTGSRYIGTTIANYYQKLAYQELKKVDVNKIINQLKSEGKHSEIQSTIKKLNESTPKVKKDLAYLEGKSFDHYIHDMKLAQRYAVDNRQEIANIIISHMNLTKIDEFDTIHNYIDTDNMILRKGAVSAQKGERLIIPINMRDGSIIAIGKGNPDWNYSAPHGAGRVLSRSMARKQLNLEEYKDTMKDVWTTSVGTDTIDEAPMAYKRMKDILDNIGDTVEIIKVIKPVYNFKAAEEPKFWEKKGKFK
ncbi:RtcB family protein [Heyndrickxia camelliae]|uniref:3'-phosphate/5'-hydroxy nucleic acid ligase n=1 Tax=Heyndrickxia camelliae TaxID=1707093 RepID=A0A2N3LMJ6_9BACI|nr:RtcB family protein [Heyndrickxia camelliae]PKR85769.1 RNA-splicing ligase RtcB [Heyndrickxia camelliae]